MKNREIIYQQGEHQWTVVSRDRNKAEQLIDTNEYLITKSGKGLLLDPGGSQIFPAVFSAISQIYNPSDISAIFASHQDPDVISSLGLWLDFNPEIRCYSSSLWVSFIAHFGGEKETFIDIPDEGMEILFNGLVLEAIPAHYLHSPGNFHLYDSTAKILFSGDVGTALLPEDQNGLFVTDFDQHIKFSEDFHKRWMGSNKAKKVWCDRVQKMDIDMLCPQHGAIYQGEDVKRFIDWFYHLDVGIY